MTESVDLLGRAEPPWTLVDRVTEEDLRWLPGVLYGVGLKGFGCRKLRGRKMRTMEQLMNEFAAALQFFDEFGENWHALKDCLESLDEWMKAERYVLVVTNASEVLADDERQAKWLSKILDEVGDWWSKPISDNGPFNRPAIPFHTVFQVRNRDWETFCGRFGETPELQRGPLP